jgi:hypothetical protein
MLGAVLVDLRQFCEQVVLAAVEVLHILCRQLPERITRAVEVGVVLVLIAVPA